MMKVFLILLPTVFYSTGIYNTYQAYHIFKEYKRDEELWHMLEKEGAFEGKDVA